MKLVGVVLVTLLLLAAPAADATSGERDQLKPNWGAVLPPAAATDFLSSLRPSDAWKPDAAQFARMETALAAKLTEELAASQCSRHEPCKHRRQVTYVTSQPRRTNDYYRQYGAFHYKGKSTVFVRGFHKSYLRGCKPPSTPCDPQSSNSWRSKVVEVFDGGIDHFWAIYDVDTNSVTAFSFQGNA